jgi:hypothetical protein
VNPNYHLVFGLTTLAKQTWTPPNSAQAEGTISCGNGRIAAIEINAFDNWVRGTLLKNLETAGTVSSTTMPVILVHNVIWYVNNTANCCVLGYHNSYIDSQGHKATYSIAEYDNSGFFTSGVKDIGALSHEISELVNDPFVGGGTAGPINSTKPWGGIGQVSGCQNNFETGDPLSGTFFPVTMNGFTYHPQEQAFYGWFYHQVPSGSVNGWYSNNGKFKGDAKVCPPGGTN